jgi:hypothetical protein
MKKIGNDLPPIEASARVRELHIGVQQAGKIINFIRGNLYSDKWGSFIREVLSNAYDANKVAGYEGPVEIVLPSLISSELLIRDRGLGMPYSFMDNEYANVGFSTKEESEDEVGAFGIGRLTPLLVCDQYKIDTVHKGLRHIWTMACGQKDGLIPEYQEKTDKPTGTTIRVPCEVRDISKIMGALNRWCKYLEPAPLIDGKPFSSPDSLYVMEGEGWSLSKSSKTSLTVLNGWVPYDVEDSYIPPIMKDLGHLTIRFPIGALNVTASREALEYNDQTLNVIREKVNWVFSEVMKIVDEELRKAINLRLALQLNKEYPWPIKKAAKWGGYTLKDIEIKASSCLAIKFEITKNGNLKQKEGDYEDITLEQEVFINDLTGPYKPRLKQYMLDRGFNHRNGYKLFLIPSSSLYKSMIRAMEWPMLSSIPELPKLPKVKPSPITPSEAIKTNSKSIKAYLWNNRFHTRTAPNLLKYTDEVALSTDIEGGVCLVVKNGAITRGLDRGLPESHVINNLMKCLPPETKLYLIPESSYPLMKGEWRLLDEIIREALKDKVDYYLELFISRGVLPCKPNLTEGMFKVKEGIVNLPGPTLIDQDLDPQGLMSQYLKEGLEVAKGLEDYEAYVYAASILYEPKALYLAKLYKLLQGVIKTYPLINILSRFSQLDSVIYIDPLVSYIKAIDFYLENKR